MINMNKKTIKITVLALFLIGIIIGAVYFLLLKNENGIFPKIAIKSETSSSINTLNEINAYQEQYFEIIKRHNALLNLNSDEESTKDLKELKQLFVEVKNKINTDCDFLYEYEKIKNDYKENTGNNTLEMNIFAKEKYEAFDKLLNKVYGEIKLKLPEEEFEQLKLSQQAWLKEVEDYDKVFLLQGFGTIGTLVKFDYETNMRCFRTLLLMLYL